MKLTNDQIYSLGMNGFAKINYGMLPTEDALSVYRLRRTIVKACAEIDAMAAEMRNDAWEREGQAKRASCAEYEQTKTGMTEEQYNAVIESVRSRAQAMIEALGRESRDIDVAPISFASWCLLMKDNPFLVGCEESFADFIAE